MSLYFMVSSANLQVGMQKLYASQFDTNLIIIWLHIIFMDFKHEQAKPSLKIMDPQFKGKNAKIKSEAGIW